jgi:SAM-dependent methyltransferase
VNQGRERSAASTRRLVRHGGQRLKRAVGLSRSAVTDEHFVPADGTDLAPYLAAGDQPAVHHLIRYHWAVAALQAQGRPVRRLLDVACGSGFGSELLARAFPDAEVVGADYDGAAVAHARGAYHRPNLRFAVGDVLRWGETIGDAPFDVVVSFDTIEHVVHREIMLMHLVDHLDPDGALLLSTPSARGTTTLRPSWRFHQIEYSAPALFDVMSRYFGVVLRPDDGSLPALEVFDQLQGSAVSYRLRMNPLLCLEPIRILPPG